MKKILTVLLSVAMIMMAPAAIFADEIQMEETSKNATSGEIQLTATKASEYFIKLPKSLDVSDDETTFNIYARGDIDGAKEIVIEENKLNGQDNKIEDAAGLKDAKVLTVTCAGAIAANDLDKVSYDGAQGTSMTIKHSAIEAGTWAGKLHITIKLADVVKA